MAEVVGKSLPSEGSLDAALALPARAEVRVERRVGGSPLPLGLATEVK